MATLSDAELFLSAMSKMHRTTTLGFPLEPVDNGYLPSIHLCPPTSSPTSVSTRSASPSSASSTSSTSSSHQMTTRAKAKVEYSKPVQRQKAPTVRRSERERMDILKRENLIAEIGPYEVRCLGCDNFVALDSSRVYSVHHWQQHKDLYHVPGGKMYEKEQFLRKQIGQEIKLFNSRRRPRSKRHIEIARRLKRTKGC